MKISDFDYILPKSLIAQHPLEKRDKSKLLILDKNTWNIEDRYFEDILNYLWKNDVLVINKTKVINARLKGITSKKANVEVFLHKDLWLWKWDCLVYPGKKLRKWEIVKFDGWLEWSIIDISESWRIVQFNFDWKEFLKIIENIWEVPLPPYIKEKLNDSNRYQTVFADNAWSSAAPTAWLHFSKELIKKLEKSWVKIEKVLLHVWLGTFSPVKTDDIKDHIMHSEFISIENDVALRLNKYKKDWKNIIAVWTTSIRVLESFSDENWILQSWEKETNIFIYPSYKWKFVNSLITNFHLPKSTLLMLVSALAWKENIKNAYKHAVDNKYRFFSFWDAMWIK